ncbi:MAG TPA: outer membrane beta-barrel protein [Methylovirgula sp.]|nr:outer membrane beta-barrel protein [Methylovirgula sp.]
MTFLRGFLSAVVLVAGTIIGSGYAAAADLPTTKGPPPPPPSWWSTITVNGEIDAGITWNPDNPPSGMNWGSLFTDHANEPMFNQGLLTIQRPIDSSKPQYDVGFAVQVMYGSDARFVHYLGECEYCINSLYQVALVEAYVQAHTPWVFPGGIDWKIGQWPTLEGAELIESDLNLFYSHSYIFNYAEPFQDTGVLAIAHVNPTIDLYASVVSGENTSIGFPYGDNNASPAFEGGVGLNNLGPGGAVTVLATTHIGPENPFFTGGVEPNGAGQVPAFYAGCGGFCGNSGLRYANDIVITWKATDKLTLTLDGNYTRDDALPATTYGAAGYASYQTPLDWLKINGRAEVYRDNGPSTFVGVFPGNFDFANVEHGYVNTALFGPPTTYFEVTGGVNITPTIPQSIPFLKGVIIRPEVRYDASLNNTTPFDLQGRAPGSVGTKSDQLTLGGDVILKF